MPQVITGSIGIIIITTLVVYTILLVVVIRWILKDEFAGYPDKDP